MKAKAFLTYLIVSLLIPTQGFSYPKEGCNELLRQSEFRVDYELTPSVESIRGTTIHYWRSSRRNMRKSDLVKEEPAIFLGVDGEGHTYLVAGKYRYDGELFRTQPTLRESGALSEGLVVRIPDPGGVNTKKIERYLESQGPPKSLTCVSGVCKILSNSGTDISLSRNYVDAFLPSQLLTTLAKRGVVNSKGESMDIEMIILGNKQSMRSIQDRALSRTQEKASVILAIATFLGIVGATGSQAL